ncbi:MULTISPECIES: hypothetical protein [Citrobacter]|uniref:hypothetical protein n=1 Tax=Citrobacter TaxID=544 RepID=UPI001D0735CB|nr:MULTISPECIES: hypothetical protein [Citrobacter]MCB6776376.1 hypothetical protein [Citrobacter sp. 210820-DFI.7.8]MCB6786076.1 hypothetical protein [Citrobacter sp. 210820-DFI.7.7]MCB8600560.1 hypothetical protein [Citrobacter europaeus]MCQ5004977.1 hypothetical protein [Citrobacter europaeus]
MTKTTERPMIFNGEMVRAILDGRKTQTRRVMKTQPEPSKTREGDYWFPSKKLECMVHVSDIVPCNSPIADCHLFFQEHCCPFGAAGDRIWVRETWAEACAGAPELQLYRANYPTHVPSHYENVPPAEEIRWTPSIHMPRWASRILLEITDVRVERLNAISQANAIAEGAPPSHPSIDCVSQEYGFPDFSRSWFGQTWQHIYGEGSWQANPWVWVIEFKRIEGNSHATN